MTKETSPKDTSYDRISDNGLVLDPEQEISPEKLAELNNALALFLNGLPSRDEVDDGSTVKTYDETLEYNDKFVVVSALTLDYGEFGTVQRPIVNIAVGSAMSGLGYGDDFRFGVEDTAFNQGESLTIDEETGKVISGSREKLSFIDNQAIKQRTQELLEDFTFEGPSRGITLPNFKETPSGEIYQEGVQVATHTNPLPEIAVGVTLFFDNDGEASVHRRRMAASKRALEEIGVTLTNERADRVITLLKELSSGRES